jgi:hypothetical protein
MTTVLLTLGDSWPQGVELKSTEQRYGEILKQLLKFDEFYNYGQGGSSNEHMISQLQHYFETHHRPDHQTTAVFFLTNPHRTAYFPPDAGLNVHGHERQNWNKEAKEVFMKNWLHFYSDENSIMRSSITITALQQWCKLYNIDDYYFSGWIKYTQWLPMVNTDKIWAKGLETAADWFGAADHNGEHLLNVGNNAYIQPNHAHPNQMGHQLIADKLKTWILR